MTEHPEPLSSEEIAALRRNVEGYTPGSARRTRTLRLIATIDAKEAEIAALREENVAYAQHSKHVEALWAAAVEDRNAAEAEAAGLLRRALDADAYDCIAQREPECFEACEAFLAKHEPKAVS